MKKQTLWLELLLLYIIPPLLFITHVLPSTALMPLLWVLTLYAFLHLRYTKVRLFSLDFSRSDLLFVFNRFALIGAGLTLYVLVYRPEIFLDLVERRPLLWISLIFLYPIFSAYLQEILFRAYFFKRYKRLFKDDPLSHLVERTAVFLHPYRL